MTEPSGRIIARPMVARACGHEQEFQYYAVDKYRAQRLAKFQKTRCADCVAKMVAEEQKKSEATPSKGEVLNTLPTGAQVTLTRQPNGSWAGKLTANGKTVETVGIVGAGPQAVIIAMARMLTPEAKPQ